MLCAMWLGACAPPVTPSIPRGAAKARAPATVSPRSGKVADFPCSQCHDKVDPQVLLGGETKKHEVSVTHGGLACVICHDAAKTDRLRLLAGGTTSFDTAEVLCGQCHFDKLADWKIGAHGKEVGKWNGQRNRLACPDCHRPHDPAIAKVLAKPPPPFPKLGIRKGASPKGEKH